MNTQDPRWTCRIIRGARSLTGNDAPDRGFGARHIATCHDCQAYFAALNNVGRALTQNAHEIREPAPAGFDARVLAAIREEAPARRTRERHIGRVVFALAGVTAAVVLAVLPLQHRREGTSGKVDPTAGVQLKKAIDALPALNVSVESVLEKEPLQKEVDSMYADARSAVDFLALNFLPDASARAANGRPTTSGG